jgi:hypothetical protein
MRFPAILLLGPTMDSAKYDSAETMNAFERALNACGRADYESVLSMALPHAIQGDPDAQCMLSLLYQCDFGVDRNVLEAERWLLKATKQNHALAWNNLGTLYAMKLPELEHHWNDATECYEKAKQLGFNCAEPYPPPSNVSREKTMPIPTEANWGNYHNDLDREYAHKLFAGRTNEEMLPHFRRNVIERTDELRWMPEIPFRYYMLGFRDYIMAGDFPHLKASDAASCFLGLILEKLQKHPDAILPIMPELFPAARYVAMHQSSFEATESIYGNFQEKLRQIESLYTDPA